MWHAGDLFIYNSGCMVVVIVHTQRTIYLPKLSTFCSRKKNVVMICSVYIMVQLSLKTFSTLLVCMVNAEYCTELNVCSALIVFWKLTGIDYCK